MSDQIVTQKPVAPKVQPRKRLHIKTLFALYIVLLITLFIVALPLLNAWLGSPTGTVVDIYSLMITITFVTFVIWTIL